MDLLNICSPRIINTPTFHLEWNHKRCHRDWTNKRSKSHTVRPGTRMAVESARFVSATWIAAKQTNAHAAKAVWCRMASKPQYWLILFILTRIPCLLAKPSLCANVHFEIVSTCPLFIVLHFALMHLSLHPAPLSSEHAFRRLRSSDYSIWFVPMRNRLSLQHPFSDEYCIYVVCDVAKRRRWQMRWFAAHWIRFHPVVIHCFARFNFVFFSFSNLNCYVFELWTTAAASSTTTTTAVDGNTWYINQ